MTAPLPTSRRELAARLRAADPDTRRAVIRVVVTRSIRRRRRHR